MANYFFNVDGPEVGSVGPGEQAVVGNLAFFDTTDTVTGAVGALLGFAIAGDIVLNLTGYAGITGFATLSPQSFGGTINLTIGQDFYTGNAAGALLTVLALADVQVILNASALDSASAVLLRSFSGTADILTGGDGNDHLAGAGGADQLNGGAGIDAARYDLSPGAVTVDLAAGTGIGSDAQGDAYTSIEAATGSAFNDRLLGDAGTNFLVGLNGDDTLRGGAGADVLDGGAGSDFVNYQGSSAEVFVDIQNGLIFSGDATGDQLTSIENIYGSSFSDTLAGDAGRNIIGGEGGADLIDGRGGDDALAGEAGNDILNGMDGNDRLVGGDGTDSLSGAAGNDSMDGGAGNDGAFGHAGNDSITGGAGADQLDGGDDNDFLEGGADADSLTGGAGIDTASYAGSGAGVIVVLGGASSGGDAQGDTLAGIEQVMGSGFADTITGDAGANTLWGLSGDDVLTGGAGADVLKGGAGNDHFSYGATGDSTLAAAGRDTITDFTTGDRIDLSAIDANGAGPGNTAFTFGTGAFTAAGQIRVLDFGGGRYGVYLETTGNNVEDALITVYSDHALTAADFVL
ncbi:Ca2+-binding RTX toxin-like protein [Inquilinus ginsengisoli]|uniref:calcium-binding protein n=1 Tax=Inquilinus ginsengisoli TaxID=363840 RepID=UPI003D25A06B